MIDKNSLDDYIENHLSAFQQEEVNNSGNVEYKMALVSQERGLYSGIVSYFNSAGSKEYREFIVDFVNRELTIKGITGKELKATPANLNKVFNYGYYHEVEENSEDITNTLICFKHLGLLYGSIYHEPVQYLNIGRGVYRALTYYPMAEQVVKEFKDQLEDIYRFRNTMEKSHLDNMRYPWITLIAVLQHLHNEKGGSNNRKLLGLNKKQYTNFIQELPRMNEMIYIGVDNLERLLMQVCTGLTASNVVEVMYKYSAPLINRMVQIAVRLSEYDYDKMKATLAEVDKQRGYHESEDYLKECWESIRMYARNLSYQQRYFLTSLAEKGKTDVYTLASYLYASCYHQQALEFGKATEVLADYYSCLDTDEKFIKFPRFLKTAHDIAARNTAELGNSVYTKQVYASYQAHKQLEMTINSKYDFIVAMAPKEIVNEGNNQHNCVGGYVRYVAEGRSIICFLRKHEDPTHSWVTIELAKEDEGLRLAQIYQTNNAEISEEQQKAVGMWLKQNNIIHKHITGLSQFKNAYVKAPSSVKPIDMEVHKKAIEAHEAWVEKHKELNQAEGIKQAV